MLLAVDGTSSEKTVIAEKHCIVNEEIAYQWEQQQGKKHNELFDVVNLKIDARGMRVRKDLGGVSWVCRL